MPSLSLEHSVTVSDNTLFRELNGEAVLLQVDAGMYYGLDDVGTRLWQLMLEHRRLQLVLDAALAEFEVDPADLQRDLLDLTQQLVDRGLLVATAGQREE
jgi:hypothetical protein